MNLVAIALFIIMAVILMKFKLVCEVTANGEKLGYIIDKEQFEQSINDMMTNEDNQREQQVEYHLAFINKTEETNDEEVLAKAEEKINAVTGQENGVTIKIASAKLTGSKTTTTTSSSKKVTSRGTSTTSKSTTTKTITTKSTSSTKKTTTTSSSSSKTTSLNGVQLTVKPVSGTITSRFGSRESIRSSGHTGIDIAAPKGTKIKAAAGGTVIFAGYSGAYGNVVKISHGSGIKTYYAHCSKLYVKEGQKVSVGDVIAAVGSTGRSTGNHLHFEVIKNGTSVNPQNYLYK